MNKEAKYGYISGYRDFGSGLDSVRGLVFAPRFRDSADDFGGSAQQNVIGCENQD
ncbi:hypothetical protein GZH47_13325 [Paenibacillus rhizovicinus]|uniref:Uncharacterized protein n=1 Tax=Paenibacillus rhizovicinus TaxID=2704463 RepID=A0A6C0P4X7_9BACL|nr:hypothetical protein [Paenibacillus rhizovicinus]QHW31722.1 hypothetical protein GZH47_13325 [Paenibacillus rhizovicinus]